MNENYIGEWESKCSSEELKTESTADLFGKAF